MAVAAPAQLEIVEAVLVDNVQLLVVNIFLERVARDAAVKGREERVIKAQTETVGLCSHRALVMTTAACVAAESQRSSDGEARVPRAAPGEPVASRREQFIDQPAARR